MTRFWLEQVLDLQHLLAVLASRMPWHEIEASLAHQFARQATESIAGREGGLKTAYQGVLSPVAMS